VVADQQPAASVATSAGVDVGTIEYVRWEGKFSESMWVGSLAELESKACAIAEVTVLDSTLHRSDVPEGYPESGPILGNTLTRVTVDKVHKSDGRISEGSVCTIIEAYTSKPDPSNPNNTIVYVHGNVIPMKVGGRYLLFLAPSDRDYGDYWILGLWTGKYRISDGLREARSFADLSEAAVEAAYGPSGLPSYWAIGEEVKNKYIDKE
jgi:hypothetical protein